MITFPDGFLWGAATSHFQVEGNPFEISTRCSDWAEWTVSDGRIADRTTADQACQFFTRYPDDLELLRQLNLNTFRISLNWPAICPEASPASSPLAVDREQIEHYRKLLSKLKEQGIKTRWLAESGDAGGIQSPGSTSGARIQRTCRLLDHD